MSKKTIKLDAAKLRKDSGLNQADFWRRFGVTQSGGSRYENGRPMPKPLRLLIVLATARGTFGQLADGSLAAAV